MINSIVEQRNVSGWNTAIVHVKRMFSHSKHVSRKVQHRPPVVWRTKEGLQSVNISVVGLWDTSSRVHQRYIL